MAAGSDALAKAPDDVHRSHFRDWQLSAVYHNPSFTDGPLETYLDYISGWMGQPSQFQHQVRHYDPVHTMEVTDRLSELGQLPVQLIWGADDGWQVVDWAHKLQNAIPGSRLRVLEECGHFSPEDQPERIAALVLDHIAKARQRAV